MLSLAAISWSGGRGINSLVSGEGRRVSPRGILQRRGGSSILPSEQRVENNSSRYAPPTDTRIAFVQ